MSCTEIEIDSIFDEKKGNTAVAAIYMATPVESKIESIFYDVVMPVTWYSFNSVAFTMVAEEKSYTYKAPSGYSYLLYSYLSAETVALSVKDEYRENTMIAWCYNLLSEMVVSANCSIDKTHYFGSFDKHWLIMRPEFYLNPGHEDSYDRGIGNTPDIQTFKTSLPRKRLKANQPWFYGYCSGAAFPLFRLSSQSTFMHTYKYNLKLSDLLRMATLNDDGKWVTCSQPDLSRLNGVPPDGQLSPPTLWSNTGRIRENEVIWNECNRKTYDIYTDTVVNYDSPVVKCGSSIQADLKSDGPCKAFFWAFHNKTAAAMNIHSNYTTSITSMEDGDTPGGVCSLLFSTGPKFEEMDFDHFSGPLLDHHFVRGPRNRGFQGYTFCYDINSYGHNVAINLTDVGAKFIATVEDPEIKKWKNGTADVRGETVTICQHEFILVVRMLVMHKFTIGMDEERKIKIKKIY